MELTLDEAAALMGVKRRTLRAKLQRGEIVGRKVGGRWLIRRAALPLDERQRRDAVARADTLREALDTALPSRAQTSREREPYSVVDREAFVTATRLLRALEGRSDPSSELVPTWRACIADLAEAAHVYGRDEKVAALQRARRGAARVVGELMSQVDPGSLELGRQIEVELLPSLAGWIRWTERRGRRGRDSGAQEELP